jgi:protein associated with RNAse G/E
MRFQIETPEAVHPIIKVSQAIKVGDYSLEIKFSDGKINQIDFQEFLEKSVHPEIRKYLDQALFEAFEVKDGNVSWNDYDLIFPMADLYSGKIS